MPGTGQPSGAPLTLGSFTEVVSFGDNLSDMGACEPASSSTGSSAPPYIGGKFTINTATGTVWGQNVATRLGLLTTLAELGFGALTV